MEVEKTMGALIADNSIVGAAIAAGLAFLYKIWRILKADRKEDDLDAAERKFRDEMRQEIKDLRTSNAEIKREEEDCKKQYIALQAHVQWVENCLELCQKKHPSDCPLIEHWSGIKFGQMGNKKDAR
jgi:hypothetical protein